MDLGTAKKIYNDKRSSKEQLRSALAFALGIEHKEKETETVSIYKRCLTFFLQQYKYETGIDYVFGSKDGIALAGILKKIEKLGVADNRVYETFEALIVKLPAWYKTNAYSPPVINSKFNEIVTAIKNNNGQTKQPVTASYKQRIIDDLLA